MKRSLTVALLCAAAATPAPAALAAEVSAPAQSSSSEALSEAGSRASLREERREERARLREERRQARALRHEERQQLRASASTRRCRLSLSLPQESQLAGQAAVLVGSLRCPEAEDASGRSVTIEQHTAAAPGYQVLGSATTTAGGAFTYTTPAALSAASIFRAVLAGARTARATARPEPTISLSGPAPGAEVMPAGRRAGAAAIAARTITFTGKVSPDVEGSRVVLQREDRRGGGSWRRIGSAEVGAGGSYSIAHAFVLSGAAVVRVVLRAHGLHAVASEALGFEVASRENPRLTLESSNLTPSYGQTVDLSGTAAAGAGTRLTLLADDPGSLHRVLASTVAGAGGHYEFAPQTITSDVSFVVKSAGTRSASVRELMRPLLTLQSPPASVEAGTPLRVCGTLTPAPAGAAGAVLLQRQDGAGFSTLAEGDVQAGGAFCVEATPAQAGAARYRVKVPVAAQAGAAASAVFAVTVSAPAPGASTEDEGGEAAPLS